MGYNPNRNINIIELSLSNVMNSDNKDTDVYVKKAHPVLTSSLIIIINVPETMGNAKLNTGITPVKNILTKHNADTIPPKATL
jgi:hypothetical protein